MWGTIQQTVIQYNPRQALFFPFLFILFFGPHGRERKKEKENMVPGKATGTGFRIALSPGSSSGSSVIVIGPGSWMLILFILFSRLIIIIITEKRKKKEKKNSLSTICPDLILVMSASCTPYIIIRFQTPIRCRDVKYGAPNMQADPEICLLRTLSIWKRSWPYILHFVHTIRIVIRLNLYTFIRAYRCHANLLLLSMLTE